MAENSKIEWTHHTFNPWSGCTKVSAGCANCYAEVNYSVKMRGVKWGPQGNRIVKAESGWFEPLKWDRDAAAAGERRRVFCASLADVFEDWQGPMTAPHGDVFLGKDYRASDGKNRLTMDDVRARLFAIIRKTPNLDWLLLTKRPENILRMLPPKCLFLNIWFGTSVEDRKAVERIAILRKVASTVRFISVEPLLEDVGKLDLRGIDWVIIGGESGHGARPCNVDHIRSIVRQCQAAGVACHVKQFGSAAEDVMIGSDELQPLFLRHKKGGDMSEWPADLQVREYPKVIA